MSNLRYAVPGIEDLRKEVQRAFGVLPCMFQARDAIAQLEQKDCITISPTGSGKTLTFWIPLLFNNNGIIIIVTALNILGDKNVEELSKLSISAVNVTGASATDELFKEIEDGKHRVVVASPEKVLNDSRFGNLWKSKKFTSRLFNITFDEGHCISQWGEAFRPEYAQLGRLRWLIPAHVPFHVVSATMPKSVLNDVKTKLQMRAEKTVVIQRSNDRPNIHIMVEEMQYSLRSMLDLERVLQLNGLNPPPKFMVFVNRRKESEEIVEFQWDDLPPGLRDKVVWFHSGMSSQFRDDAIKRLRDGELWGIICTDAAGMGLDLPDIELVIQWRYVSSLCTLTQRLGRGGRKTGTEASGIYLVEPKYFDNHKKKATAPNSQMKRKSTNTTGRGRKRQRTGLLAIARNESDPASDGTEDEEEGVQPSTSAAAASQVDRPPVHPHPPPSTNLMDVDRDENIPFPDTEHTPSAHNSPHKSYLPEPYNISDIEYEFSAMDLFINVRSRKICRRKIMDEYFGNNKLRTTNEQCCDRCSHRGSRLCCDICNPGAFILPVVPPSKLGEKTQRKKRKLKFKGYSMDRYDFKLHDELDDWREKQMVLEGLGLDDFFGPQLLLSDDILERIVDLSHHSKVHDIQSLIDQTGWRHAGRYGTHIIEIIKSCARPITPVPPTPPVVQSTLHNVENGVVGTSDKVTGRRCKACGAMTHIASNKLCPRFTPKERVCDNGTDENTPLAELPASAQSLLAGTLPPSEISVAPTRKARLCGACGAAGHIASNKVCPNWKSKEERQKKIL